MKKSDQQQSLDMDLSGAKYTPPSKKLVKEILAHYRKVGFPYIELSEYEKVDEFMALKNFKTPLIHGKEVYADSTGVSLANMYHKHRYAVECGGNKTALYVFSRDWLFEKAILKCFKLMGDVSPSKLRSMLSIFEGVQVASNFPPATAKAIYEKFLPNGGNVWDMSCGWGGRLLAAMSTAAVDGYFGTEPSTKTVAGLIQMTMDIRNLPIETWRYEKTIQILPSGSETPLPDFWPTMDLCFTSPPYFTAEKYAREETQSFLKFPYTSDWMKYFIGETMANCLKVTKPSGRILFNVANVKSFPNLEEQLVKEAERRGLILEDILYLLYTAMPGSGKKNRQEGDGTKRRREPIFVFKPK